MSTFMLRNIDTDFWKQVQQKAAAEGTTVKALILRLLAQWLAAVVVLGLSAGCGYKLPTEPTTVVGVPSSAPASIRLGVSSITDRTYSITATVLTSDGHFVPGVLVTFAMDSGAVTPAEATTNANGVVQAVASPTTTAATLTVSGGSLTSTTPIAPAPAALVPAPPILLPPVPAPPPSNPQPVPPPVVPPPTTPAPPPLAPAALAASMTCTVTGLTAGCNVAAKYGSTNVPSTDIRRIEWDFGDGRSAIVNNSPVVSHPYAQPGTYLVVAGIHADVTVDGVFIPKTTMTSQTVEIK